GGRQRWQVGQQQRWRWLVWVAGGDSMAAASREEEGLMRLPRWQCARLEAIAATGCSDDRGGDEEGWSMVGVGGNSSKGAATQLGASGSTDGSG
ncbi:hypothetical protein GW17_00035933, partial [Ensete ventricosum]